MKGEKKDVRWIILALSFIIGTTVLLFLFPECAKNDSITGRVEKFIGKGRLTPMHIIGALASKNAMEKLSLSRGDHDMIVITNAGYAIIKGKTTEQSIDGIIAATGCTPRIDRYFYMSCLFA